MALHQLREGGFVALVDEALHELGVGQIGRGMLAQSVKPI
jgi:hypothetical protein